MAANLSVHLPIQVVSTLSGNQEKIQNFLEGSAQTFPQGSLVTLGSFGASPGPAGTYCEVFTGGSGNVTGVLGVSNLPGKNLATNGQGASPDFGSIGYPGGSGAVQNVVNQSSAYSIYHGAPFVDGLTNVALATQDTIFEVQVDASTGATYNATQALVGDLIGLTVDSSGYWYADLGHLNNSSYNLATVVSLNPQDLVAGSTTTQINNGRIRIIFLASASQL